MGGHPSECAAGSWHRLLVPTPLARVLDHCHRKRSLDSVWCTIQPRGWRVDGSKNAIHRAPGVNDPRIDHSIRSKIGCQKSASSWVAGITRDLSTTFKKFWMIGILFAPPPSAIGVARSASVIGPWQLQSYPSPIQKNPIPWKRSIQLVGQFLNQATRIHSS